MGAGWLIVCFSSRFLDCAVYPGAVDYMLPNYNVIFTFYI